MTGSQLNETTVEDGIELFIEHRRSDASEETIRSYQYRLKPFNQWFNQISNLEALEQLEPIHVHKFKTWRSKQIKNTTLKCQLDTLRVFLDYMEKLNLCSNELSEAVESPSLEASDEVRSDILSREEAQAILTYLSKFEYASRSHALLLFLWETGARLSGLRAVDLDDYSSDEMYIEFVNREGQTRLKNGNGGERLAALSPNVCEVLDDYIEQNRYDVQDEAGREPLFTSQYGRASKQGVRQWVYGLTRPCIRGETCPHDRDPDECRAARRRGYAYECPSSVASHAVRRGAVTSMLSNDDTPIKAVGDRVNAEVETLEKHYDARSEKSKMEKRRQFFE